MAERGIVAEALATAFLAEQRWTRDRLTARATDVLGERPPWLSKLVARLVAHYQDPPEGRRRELTHFVSEDPYLRAACASGHSPTVRIWPVASVEAWDSRWHVRPLSTTRDVATWLGLRVQELDWFADTHGLERHAANESLRHYRYRWISKRSDGSGGVRLLEAPKPRTKAIQRAILHEILDMIPTHDAAHGFRRGRSVQTHAAPHAGKAVVIRLDLADFFLSVSAARVAAVFRSAGYPEDVAFVLACLCTNRAPSAALAHVHGPYATRYDVEAWWRARTLARTRHLPQGSPTSPALANLVTFGLDVRLCAAAAGAGCSYSRYADDLVFSGSADFARDAIRFAAFAASIAFEEGFVVNHRKTRIMRAGGRQTITGLVVNHHARVPREAFEALKATLHNCVRFGPATQNREGRADFRAHLRGLVAWVAASDAARGERLGRMFEAIRWE